METQTMTPVEVIVPCPSCARPMSSVGSSWQCLACHPTPVDVPTCATQKCKRPLTKLGEPWNCWICLKCNTHPEEVNKMKKEDDQRKRTYVDQKLTTEDVSEMIKKEMASVKDMIRDALAKPAYPPTQAEIRTMTDPILENALVVNQTGAAPVIKPETYLQKAKRLGVATHIPTGGMRKKAEIMVDIEKAEQSRENESRGNELLDDVLKDTESIEDANTFRENAQAPPGEDAEFARGLTKEDMM